MKRILILFTVLLFTAFLAACGDDDEVTNQPQENDTATENQDTANDQNDAAIEEDLGDDSTPGDATENTDRSEADGTASLNTDYMFTSFDLEIDIENDDDAIDVDYDDERDENETEASYENKPQDINLQGDEAMNALDGIFTGFQFDENTPDDEVIDEVLEAFNVTEEPAKFDLEIEFANGTEKEYRR